MKLGILSDVHGNLPALEACLLHGGDVDEWVSLGDVIGYGPFTNECLQRITSVCKFSILGNHEDAVGSLAGFFGPQIKEQKAESYRDEMCVMFNWVVNSLSSKGHDILTQLMRYGEYSYSNGKLNIFNTPIGFYHTNPHNPAGMRYIRTQQEAYDYCINAPSVKPALNFVGHSHLPQALVQNPDGTLNYTKFNDNFDLLLDTAKKSLIVVPSVGQPRDGNPQTGYAVLDTHSLHVSMRRLDYDIAQVERRLISVDYPCPEYLLARLKQGL